MILHTFIGIVWALAVWFLWAMRDTVAVRVRVLEALLTGPKLGRDLPIRLGARYRLLVRMELEQLIRSEPLPDGARVYRIDDQGVRLLGEQDR
jgi:hypothetical protein